MNCFQIFFNSIGKRGTLAIWTFMIITLWMTGMDYVRQCCSSLMLLTLFFFLLNQHSSSSSRGHVNYSHSLAIEPFHSQLSSTTSTPTLEHLYTRCASWHSCHCFWLSFRSPVLSPSAQCSRWALSASISASLLPLWQDGLVAESLFMGRSIWDLWWAHSLFVSVFSALL